MIVQIFPARKHGGESLRWVSFGNSSAAGESWRRSTASTFLACPRGIVGPALLETVVLTTDERTNTVIAAGKESAIALVEVLKSRLDLEIGVGWVEPRIIALKYADAVELAAVIRRIVS